MQGYLRDLRKKAWNKSCKVTSHLTSLVVSRILRFLQLKKDVFCLGVTDIHFFYKDLCLKSLNTLEKAGLIKMDDGFDLKPTGK